MLLTWFPKDAKVARFEHETLKYKSELEEVKLVLLETSSKVRLSLTSKFAPIELHYSYAKMKSKLLSFNLNSNDGQRTTRGRNSTEKIARML